jgi:hypothetical protein
VVLNGSVTDPDTPTGYAILWDYGDGTTMTNTCKRSGSLVYFYHEGHKGHTKSTKEEKLGVLRASFVVKNTST